MNKEPNPFGELLGLLSDEELIRLRWRAEHTHKPWLAEILSDELEEREAIEKAKAQSDAPGS